MAATKRQLRDLMNKYNKMRHQKNLDPLTQLRAHVLSNGPASLKSLHR